MSSCNCDKLLGSIGRPPDFVLKPPPMLPDSLLAEIYTGFNQLNSKLPPDSVLQQCLRINNTQLSLLAAKSSPTIETAHSNSFILVTIIVIIVLIVLLVLFILVAVVLVYSTRTKLSKKAKLNSVGTTTATSSTANTNSSYLISNSSNLQFYPDSTSSSSAAASPKSESISFLNETDFIQADSSAAHLHPNNCSLQFIGLNSFRQTTTRCNRNAKLVNSTVSSFCDSQSILIKQNKKTPNALSVSSTSSSSSTCASTASSAVASSNRLGFNRQYLQPPSAENEQQQHQYESISDLSQLYFDVDGPCNQQAHRTSIVLSPHNLNRLGQQDTMLYYPQPGKCNCRNNQHQAECKLFIQQQILMFNRKNNQQQQQQQHPTYLNSLIV